MRAAGAPQDRTAPLLLGIGNPDCGDDGVGPLAATLLRGLVHDDVQIVQQNGAAADLVEQLRHADCVFLVDAAVSGAPPGTLHVIDCTAGETLPSGPAASSHGLGVAQAIELTRLLHGLPRVCRVYAIEGVAFAPGDAMTQAVVTAAEMLVARLAQDLRQCRDSVIPRRAATKHSAAH